MNFKYYIPTKILFGRGQLANLHKEKLPGTRALIVTTGGRSVVDNGYLARTEEELKAAGCTFVLFNKITANPDRSEVMDGAALAKAENCDFIVGLGGGSPIDAGKIMWLMYEHPELKFEDLAMRFMDIRKRIFEFPQLGEKAVMVAIPTTSGTGSEVTPFSIITDDHEGVKYAVADYALTPSMAIIDSDLVQRMPKVVCLSAVLLCDSRLLCPRESSYGGDAGRYGVCECVFGRLPLHGA